MNSFKAGDVIKYGWRVTGGITYNNGVVLPYGGGNTIYIMSDYDCEIHAFRRLKNGNYILDVETRDDPKQRLWVKRTKMPPNGPLRADLPWVLHEVAANPNNDWVRELWDQYQQQ